MLAHEFVFSFRHCEEGNPDAAIQVNLDCFATLAMTEVIFLYEAQAIGK